MKWANTFSILGILITAPLYAQSGDPVGTLTAVEGEVILLSHPSKKFSNTTPPPVLYEGEYFTSQRAQTGMRVENSNVLRTSLQGKARVIYENGDQFNLGPGTSYRINWLKKAKGFETKMELLHGKIRGIIDKAGPRNQFRVRTRAAVIGIRGTDFCISSEGAENKTEVSILRGAVEMRSIVAPPTARVAAKPQVTIIRAGEIGAIAPPVVAKPATSEAQKTPLPLITPQVEIRKTTQEELISIQKVAEFKPQENSATINKAVTVLEQKAKEVTLRDIKTYDPKLFAQIQTDPQKATSLNEINAASVTELYKTAPKAPVVSPSKPRGSELDKDDQDIYKKYFKDLKQ
ncbi:FecR family protein [Bdellovibrionota bacterium FG-2]